LEGICGGLFFLNRFLRQSGKEGITEYFNAIVGKFHFKEIKNT